MQFVRNSYSQNPIPEPTDTMGILEHIERIGRLCYRSDGLIEPGSAPGFIERLKKNKHWAMLEHYIFTISIPKWIYQSITDPMWFNSENSDYNEKFDFIRVTRWDDAPDPKYQYLVSGSATSFNYLWACKCVSEMENRGMYQLCEFLRFYHPHLMCDPLKREIADTEVPGDRFNVHIQFLSRDEVKSLPTNLRMLHDWMSVHFVLERSSTHDLVRMRPCSYGQESTRYCNYDKKGLCFVIPCQFSENDKQILETPSKLEFVLNNPDDVCFGMSMEARFWLKTLKAASDSYTTLLNVYGQTPQEAKSVLPHCLRAEINMTTYIKEWHHVLKMRADKHAYPQLQEVMVPLLNECIIADPEIFKDLAKLVEEGARFVKS